MAKKPPKPDRAALAIAGHNPLTGEYLPRGRDEATAGAVQLAAGLGFSPDEIAILCNVDPFALSRFYGAELESGALHANHEVAQAFLNAAKSGEDWRASEAWLRYRGGWQDKQRAENGAILIEINLG